MAASFQCQLMGAGLGKALPLVAIIIGACRNDAAMTDVRQVRLSLTQQSSAIYYNHSLSMTTELLSGA
jgi:hypothetical protein